MSESYYVINMETSKLELHFDKSDYMDLSDEQKREIKSAFVWGRKSGCWISRAKQPNLYRAQKVAESIGLDNAGKTGERLSYAEQMQRKADKAERRAERFDRRSENHAAEGERLQQPIRDMHGDISFFTQPNINTSAGRAFTRRRERMFAAFGLGFDELRQSAYWKDRAETARRTAAQKELQDKGFVSRRIKEREKTIRALKKNIETAESYIARADAGEQEIKDVFGYTVNIERQREYLEQYLDRMEAALDELGFYQSVLDDLGGVKFSKDNLKPGDIITLRRWGRCKIISTGPKNVKYKILTDDGRMDMFTLQAAYAEILSKEEPEPAEQITLEEILNILK